MTDEEKEKYRGGLIATCKIYCHIDYDDDIEILELIKDVLISQRKINAAGKLRMSAIWI